MADWRAQILNHFTPQASRLTIAADPDGLLLEEGMLQAILERGFEVMPFEDSIGFRYAHESRFRSHWDQAQETDAAVVLRSPSDDLSRLPYDLLQAGRKLSFGLADIFPNLSYPVVASLDRSDLDALYRAQSQHGPGVLGANATKDFILRHVFEVAPELIKQPSDLLRVLLRRHYRGERLPQALDDRLIQLLRTNPVFDAWDLERVVPDRQAFLLFLQERWPVFVHRSSGEPEEPDAEEECLPDLEVSGPLHLPFDHDDVRIYIDNLFVEGLLTPLAPGPTGPLAAEWIAVGIRRDPEGDRLRRFDRLASTIEQAVPPPHARHQEWLSFAYRWAELTVLVHESRHEPDTARRRCLSVLTETVDASFAAWVESRYAGLHNLPATSPAMVHHIPRALAREVAKAGRHRVALLLLDGLALDQWIVLRQALLVQRPELRLTEDSVFAWAPTITSVSRQAAFAGKVPLYFPGSILTTAKDGAQWSSFWRDQGFAPHEMSYVGSVDDSDLSALQIALSDGRIRALGLVLDKCDRIMHGMVLGTAGMHNQVSQWASEGGFRDLMDLLHEHGFSVFVTSDHGNVEARGIGRPNEGVLTQSRGRRVMIYGDRVLRSAAAEKYPGALEWPCVGLPEDFLPLLAPGRAAFATADEVFVTHGGVALEELIVPLIRVERRSP